MGRAWQALAACFGSGPPHAHAPRPAPAARGDGAALGESTLDLQAAQGTDLRVQLEGSAEPPSAFASRDAHPDSAEGSRDGTATTVVKQPVRWGSLEHHERPVSRGASVPSIAGGNRVGSTSVRFANVPDLDLEAAPSTTSRPSRLRLQVPGDEGSGADTSVGTSVATSRNNSCTAGAPAPGKDTESRALTQLMSKLIARDVNYRAEFETIMDTFGPNFPKSCFETFLREHSITLPNNRQTILITIYQSPEDADRIDGVSLLKDLDRAAFKRFAIARTASGKPGGGPGADSQRRASAASVQRSDKSRIMNLVSTHLNREKSFSIVAGGDMLTDAAHIQELIEQIDLTNIAIPIGTRARYVPATDDPDSFQVPVWSLRAMHRRKQERERFLIGNDPDFKKLGQTGREALRKRLARRSMFQQQEIIAHAVVTAVRAAVEPATRKMENSIHSAAPSRAGSPGGSFNNSLRRQRSSDTSIHGGGSLRPRSAAPPRSSGASASASARRPMSAAPSGTLRAPPSPARAGTGGGTSGGGAAGSPVRGLLAVGGSGEVAPIKSILTNGSLNRRQSAASTAAGSIASSHGGAPLGGGHAKSVHLAVEPEDSAPSVANTAAAAAAAAAAGGTAGAAAAGAGTAATAATASPELVGQPKSKHAHVPEDAAAAVINRLAKLTFTTRQSEEGAEPAAGHPPAPAPAPAHAAAPSPRAATPPRAEPGPTDAAAPAALRGPSPPREPFRLTEQLDLPFPSAHAPPAPRSPASKPSSPALGQAHPPPAPRITPASPRGARGGTDTGARVVSPRPPSANSTSSSQSNDATLPGQCPPQPAVRPMSARPRTSESTRPRTAESSGSRPIGTPVSPTGTPVSPTGTPVPH